MDKELFKPVMRAIVALVLFILVKVASILTLKDIETIYPAIDVALSLAVIIVLFRFRQEFNRQLEKQLPGFPEGRSFITGIVLLLVIWILYGTFIPYSGDLPYGVYNILFFVLTLIPVYSLWNILNKHTDRVSELLFFTSFEGKRKCSCGWENPGSSSFCSRCGSPLRGKIT